MEGTIDFEIRLRGRWKMNRNRPKSVPKMGENTRKSSLGAVLEHFGDPLGAKMVQDASREASGAPCGGLLGRILGT